MPLTGQLLDPLTHDFAKLVRLVRSLGPTGCRVIGTTVSVAGELFFLIDEAARRWAAWRRGALGGFPLGELGVEVHVELVQVRY